MTTKEIKTEIQKSMDKVPESVLQEVLEYLRHAEKHTNANLKLAKSLRDILEEDNNLLQRLAK